MLNWRVSLHCPVRACQREVADVSERVVLSCCARWEPLTPAISISDVADRLLMPEHRAFLRCRWSTTSAGSLGLVSRYTLQDIFMQRFGCDLWGRHPVRDVMNRAPSASPSAPAWKRRRSRSPVACSNPITEDFGLVDEEGRYRGLGTVLDPLKAMEARIRATGCCARALVDLRESPGATGEVGKMGFARADGGRGRYHELNTPLGLGNNLALCWRELTIPCCAWPMPRRRWSTAATRIQTKRAWRRRCS